MEKPTNDIFMQLFPYSLDFRQTEMRHSPEKKKIFSQYNLSGNEMWTIPLSLKLSCFPNNTLIFYQNHQNRIIAYRMLPKKRRMCKFKIPILFETHGFLPWMASGEEK